MGIPERILRGFPGKINDGMLRGISFRIPVRVLRGTREFLEFLEKIFEEFRVVAGQIYKKNTKKIQKGLKKCEWHL